MSAHLLTNARMVLPGERIQSGSLLLADGKIAAVNPAAVPKDVSCTDCGGYLLTPGLIDIHTHGIQRHFYHYTQTPEDFAAALRVLPRYGTTCVIPTIVPPETAALLEPLGELVAALPALGGASVPGFHLEGPFVALGGAACRTLPATVRLLEEMIAACRSRIAIMSLSPEQQGILPVIERLRAAHILPFITHTRASVEQTEAAIEAGATHATHFYDVFPVPEETDAGVRPVGAVEAILADPRVSVDFIGDGVHVHPTAIRAAVAAKGWEKVLLITDSTMKQFEFSPATFIPFRDQKIVERVRRIKRKHITRHRNPDFRIQVVPDADLEFLWVTDMFHRIQQAAAAKRDIVLITPNPWPAYAKVAYLINKFRVDCRRVHTFNMDEYANEHGDIAPETWPLGFAHAFKKYFYSQIEPKLRPPEKQIRGFTNKNLRDYGPMLADLGGADICYSGPGWTGHLAFIEPDAPEFAAASLEEWKQLGPRVCTLSPFTIAQNSMHGSFGASGDLCAVPPRAATIGPAQVSAAKHRIDLHAISVGGSPVSWQRLTTRLVLHGPVTPRIPESFLQTLRTDVWVTESAAQDIEPRWDIGY